MKNFKLSKEELNIYIKLVIASLLYVLPIMLADRYYNDDLARALYGATGWKGDGRPVGEHMIMGLCEGLPVVDMAPLPLILAMLLLSYSLTLYAKTNLYFMNGSKQIIVMLLIVVNPFAIANFSYQFDCIIMFAALSFIFFVYALSDRTNKIIVSSCGVITGILVMSSYQATIGMSLALFLVNIYFILDGKREDIKFEFTRITAIIMGAVVYKLMIAPHFVSQDDWRLEASQLIPDLSISSVDIILRNIANVCKYIFSYLGGRSKVYQILWVSVIIASVVLNVIFFYKNTKHRGIKKNGYLLIMFLLPIMVFFSTFLPLTILNKLLIRSRIFIAFGGFLFFIGVLLFNYVKKEKLVFGVLLICIFYQYTYVYAYGNAMASQKEYEKYMAYNIVHDVESINYNGDYSEISFVGSSPKSSQLQMMCEKYPFFEEIVPVYFGNSPWIGGAWPYYYMQDGLKLVASTEEDENLYNLESPILDNSIYSCYSNEHKIVVRFKAKRKSQL